MELYPKNRIEIKEIKKFLVIFYIVGLLGFIIPFTKNLFITITPLALILSVYLLALFHREYNKPTVVLFISIFLAGYFVEVIGVKTGAVFGSYSYGPALGPKLFETPLMIGVNWLFLAYVATSIVDSLKQKSWLTLLLAPLLMVGYDLVLEQVAPLMDMWYWESAPIPLKNYLSWYLVALTMVSTIKLLKIKTDNPLSRILFICQFLFLLSLTFLL